MADNRPRLNQLADVLEALTFTEMIEFARSVKARTGTTIAEDRLAGALVMWAKQRNSPDIPAGGNNDHD